MKKLIGMKRLILLSIIGIAISTGFIHMTNIVSKDGVYKSEHKLGHSSSGNLSNVSDIRDGLAAMNINGENVLMGVGDIHHLRETHSDYKGTVELLEIKDDFVIIQTDVKRTNRYYIMYIPIILISFVFSSLICNIGRENHKS